MVENNPNQTMFKVMGSFGPAGSLVTICERVIRHFFEFAYN